MWNHPNLDWGKVKGKRVRDKNLSPLPFTLFPASVALAYY
ncbi:hypothetical protein FDUTEX481_03177 [Tolypothrix sp. PCC 7601]|nr:hypothetical protein FDUTEX481_03177 [Tolypothrix sp. PCC 7601]